jgi:hypothetical protein
MSKRLYQNKANLLYTYIDQQEDGSIKIIMYPDKSAGLVRPGYPPKHLTIRLSKEAVEAIRCNNACEPVCIQDGYEFV